MSVETEHVVLILYSLLLGVGGVIGFVRARSRASLVSGMVASVAALAAAMLSLSGYAWGIPLGALLAMVMFVVFGYRYANRNKKFMPSGLLAVISLVVLLVLMLTADWAVT